MAFPREFFPRNFYFPWSVPTTFRVEIVPYTNTNMVARKDTVPIATASLLAGGSTGLDTATPGSSIKSTFERCRGAVLIDFAVTAYAPISTAFFELSQPERFASLRCSEASHT